MKLNIFTVGKDPLIVESQYKVNINDHLAWFTVCKITTPDRDEWEYRLDWFFSKTVPRELKQESDNIIAHCKQILL